MLGRLTSRFGSHALRDVSHTNNVDMIYHFLQKELVLQVLIPSENCIKWKFSYLKLFIRRRSLYMRINKRRVWIQAGCCATRNNQVGNSFHNNLMGNCPKAIISSNQMGNCPKAIISNNQIGNTLK